jgi:putative ABC transport system permease protein
MVHLELTLSIPAEQVIKAQQVAGVERAEALIVRKALWRVPTGNIFSDTNWFAAKWSII